MCTLRCAQDSKSSFSRSHPASTRVCAMYRNAYESRSSLGIDTDVPRATVRPVFSHRVASRTESGRRFKFFRPQADAKHDCKIRTPLKDTHLELCGDDVVYLMRRIRVVFVKDPILTPIGGRVLGRIAAATRLCQFPSWVGRARSFAMIMMCSTDWSAALQMRYGCRRDTGHGRMSFGVAAPVLIAC
jgi:hypothetical protein